MTKNPDEDNICSRIERLIAEYEQSRETDSTEIGRQFAVRIINIHIEYVLTNDFILFIKAIAKDNVRCKREVP